MAVETVWSPDAQARELPSPHFMSMNSFSALAFEGGCEFSNVPAPRTTFQRSAKPSMTKKTGRLSARENSCLFSAREYSYRPPHCEKGAQGR